MMSGRGQHKDPCHTGNKIQSAGKKLGDIDEVNSKGKKSNASESNTGSGVGFFHLQTASTKPQALLVPSAQLLAWAEREQAPKFCSESLHGETHTRITPLHRAEKEDRDKPLGFFLHLPTMIFPIVLTLGHQVGLKARSLRPGLRLQLLSAEHFGQLLKAAPSFATQLPAGLVLPKQKDGKDDLGEKLQSNAEPKSNAQVYLALSPRENLEAPEMFMLFILMSCCSCSAVQCRHPREDVWLLLHTWDGERDAHYKSHEDAKRGKNL